ncbi:MAG: hypothetical protein WCX81_06060 [Monoglobales bacterium]
MEHNNYKLIKFTAFYTYLAMASVFSMPPMLFETFRQMYGISYTLLGTLVLINFCTQMIVDLILTFFSKHFNVHKTIRVMPLITAAGLLTYAVVPMIAPQMLGIVVDKVSLSGWAGDLARSLSHSTEQIGMKAGMLSAVIFPLAGIFVVLILMRKKKS